MTATNVTRLLDSHKIPYTTFELPREKLGAEETAKILGVPLEIVYKTIVVARDKPAKPVLAVIPGTCDVDLKLLAQFLGEKKVHLPSQSRFSGNH
jgi:Cys-tRNA(Pro)/Cys-tRNA(Cys) deacylase